MGQCCALLEEVTRDFLSLRPRVALKLNEHVHPLETGPRLKRVIRDVGGDVPDPAGEKLTFRQREQIAAESNKELESLGRLERQACFHTLSHRSSLPTEINGIVTLIEARAAIHVLNVPCPVGCQLGVRVKLYDRCPARRSQIGAGPGTLGA